MTIVDHRPAQSPVRNQGLRGSCVAFAVTAAHEWIASVTARSAEDALWAAHQMGGPPTYEPTWVDLALAGLAKHGHASEAAWPYGLPPFPADRPTPVGGLDLEALPQWRQLPSSTTFAEVAAALASGLAVILTLEHNVRAWQAASQSGVVDAPPGSKTVGRHAVLAVGVDTDSSDAFLIIKNSWGSTWADSGYAQLSARYFQQYVTNIHILGI